MRRLIGGTLLALLCVFSVCKAAGSEPCTYIIPPDSGYSVAIDFDGSTWVKGTFDTLSGPGFPTGYMKLRSTPLQHLYDKPGVQFTTPPGGEVPPDGISVPVFIHSPSHPVFAVNVTVEFDSTLFAFDSISTAFNPRDVFVDAYDSVDGIIYCDVSSEPGHQASDLSATLTHISLTDFILEPGEPRVEVFKLHFLFRGNPADPTWSGWETSASTVLKCAPTVSNVSTAPSANISLKLDEYPFIYNLLWGQTGLDISGAIHCTVFDAVLLPGSDETLNECASWNVGRDCIPCTGCNYPGECWDEYWNTLCRKYPCHPMHCPCDVSEP